MVLALFSVAILVLLAQVGGMEPRKSPETGRVRLLYIGVLEDWYLPYRYLSRDPFFEVHMVPANINLYRWDDLKRWARQYMPRTYGRLVEGYDVITFFGANPHVFTSRVHIWLRDSVMEGGLGTWIYGTGTYHFSDWFDYTCLRQVFPVEIESGHVSSRSTVRILKPGNPLMASLPTYEDLLFFGFRRTKPKTGAEVLAELVPASGSPGPHMVWWDIGHGRSLADSAVVGSRKEGCPVCEWEFLPDSLSNAHLYAAGLSIPSDPIQVHRVRIMLDRYHTSKRSLLSTIEFIAKFGANPIPVEEALLVAEEGLVDVEDAYLEQEFSRCLTMVESMVADLNDATLLAIELKNKALLWTQAVEWLVLTATSMLVGFVSWTIMVRRRLYRPVATTRLRQSGALT
jgi:hypothetical protein